MSILNNTLITSLELAQSRFYFMNLLMLDFNNRFKATLNKQLYGDYDVNARITGKNIFENGKLVGYEYTINHEHIGSSNTYISNLLTAIDLNITTQLLVTVRQKMKVAYVKETECKGKIIFRLPEFYQFLKSEVVDKTFNLERGLK